MGTHDFTKENSAAESAALSKEQAQRRAFNAGMEAYRQKDYRASVAHFIEAARLDELTSMKNLRALYSNAALDVYNPGEAFRWTLKAAELGDADSQFHCGYMYDTGMGVSTDKAKALFWYEKAAEQGEAAAQFNCGNMYCQGEGTAVDMSKTFYWWEKAAGQGVVDAQFACSMMCHTGEGTAVDLSKAVYWAKKAAAQGHEQAKQLLTELLKQKKQVCDKAFQLGVEAHNRQDYRASVAHFIEAARLEDLTSIKNLRMLYSNEALDVYNPEEAFRWTLKAAKLGDAESQFHCARMYASGAGVSADKAKALYWYEKAAEQGVAAAQFNCGNMYCKGEGTAADKAKALYWYEKAAEQGVAAAQFNCGSMYCKGEGTAADMTKAFYWWEKAAEQGDANAQFACSMIYHKGEGTAADPSKAVHWAEKAAAQGHEQAQKFLPALKARACDQAFQLGAEAHERQDYQAAVTHFIEAARLGSMTAKNNLRILYGDRDLEVYNPKEALRWALSAARQGDANAQFACGIRYLYGDGTNINLDRALHWFTKSAETSPSKETDRLIRLVQRFIADLELVKAGSSKIDNMLSNFSQLSREERKFLNDISGTKLSNAQEVAFRIAIASDMVANIPELLSGGFDTPENRANVQVVAATNIDIAAGLYAGPFWISYSPSLGHLKKEDKS